MLKQANSAGYNQLNPLVAYRLANIKLNAEQQQAVTAPLGNIVVSAAAGSGKTYTMTERIMLRVLSEKADLTEMLILTFTEKASRHMQTALAAKIDDIIASFNSEDKIKGRLTAEQINAARKNLSKSAANLPFTQISTIHAFCKQLVTETAEKMQNENALVAAVGQGQIGEETYLDNLLTEAAERVFEYVMLQIKSGAKLDFSDLIADLTTITSEKIAKKEPTAAAEIRGRQNDLLPEYLNSLERQISARELPELWQSLLAQTKSVKSLQEITAETKHILRQFRTYADYRRRMQEAALYAEQAALNPAAAPEFYYLLQEAVDLMPPFIEAASYWLSRAEFADLNFLAQKAAPADIKAVNAYLQNLLQTLLPALQDWLTRYRRAQQLQKPEALKLLKNDVFHSLYAELVQLGRSLPKPPEVTRGKTCKPFTFSPLPKQENSLEYAALWLEKIMPLLCLLAPQIKLCSDIKKKEYKLLLPALPLLELNSESSLAALRAKKIIFWTRLLLAVDEVYFLLKYQNHTIDFTDLEQAAYSLLQDKAVLTYCRERYKEIYVDEYQDTSDIQEAILQSLANNNLFVVGDIKQSIYAFRNAKPANFTEKVELAKLTGTWRLINFNANYRSQAGILAFCNLLFQNLLKPDSVGFDYIADGHAFNLAPQLQQAEAENKVPLAVEIVSVNEAEESCREEAMNLAAAQAAVAQFKVAGKLRGGDKLIKEKVKVGDIEADLIAFSIKKLLEREPEAEIAVLARSHAKLSKVKAALQRLNIACRLSERKNDETTEETYDNLPNREQCKWYFLVQALHNPLDDEVLATALTSDYMPLPLSLNNLAEIKATIQDLTEELKDTDEVCRTTLTYAPFYQLVYLYAASGWLKLRKGTDLPPYLQTGLYALLQKRLAENPVIPEKYIKVDLAETLLTDLQHLQRWQALFRTLSFSKAWKIILSEYIWAKKEDDSLQPLYLAAFRHYLSRAEQSNPRLTIADFAGIFTRPTDLCPEEELNSEQEINLLTFHASKGLEFEHVFIAGLDYSIKNKTTAVSFNEQLGFSMHDSVIDDLLQVISTTGLAEKILERRETYAEELRLLYVALTRAKISLHLYVNSRPSKLPTGEKLDLKPELNLLYRNSSYEKLLAYALQQKLPVTAETKLLQNRTFLPDLLLQQSFKPEIQAQVKKGPEACYNVTCLSLAERYRLLAECYLPPVLRDKLLAAAAIDVAAAVPEPEAEPILPEVKLSGTDKVEKARCLRNRQLPLIVPEKNDLNLLLDSEQAQNISPILAGVLQKTTALAQEDCAGETALIQAKKRGLQPEFEAVGADYWHNFVKQSQAQQQILQERQLAPLQSKYAVSVLKKVADKWEKEEAVALLPQLDLAVNSINVRPAELQFALADDSRNRNKQPEAAAKGTLIHRYLQLVDITSLQTQALTLDFLTRQLDYMLQNNIISAEEEQILRPVLAKLLPLYLPQQQKLALISATENTKLFQAWQAVQEGRPNAAVYREHRFTVRYPLADFLHLFSQADFNLPQLQPENMKEIKPYITIQGVIDLWLQVGEEVYLIDYKTDSLYDTKKKPGDIVEHLKKMYTLQLQLYASALQTGLHMSAAAARKHLHIYIYSVAAAGYIPLEFKFNSDC